MRQCRPFHSLVFVLLLLSGAGAFPDVDIRHQADARHAADTAKPATEPAALDLGPDPEPPLRHSTVAIVTVIQNEATWLPEWQP